MNIYAPTSIHVWRLGPFRFLYSVGSRAGTQVQATSFHLEAFGYGISLGAYRETEIGQFLGQ